MPMSGALRLRFVMGSSLLLASLFACNLSDDDFLTPGPFGGSGGIPTAVPTQTPEPVLPCTYATEGYACNYGGPNLCENGKSGNANCNDLLKCNGYEWELESIVKTKREAGVCSNTCPAEPTPGAACDTPSSRGLICDYQLTTCGCGVLAGDAGKKDAGKPEGGTDSGFVDGGKADAGPYVWTCVEPGPGCPRVRPRIGTPCVKPITCDYGSCTFDDGLSVRCSGGYWLKDTASYCP